MLLENWDKYMANSKGLDYLDRFWGPKSKDFALPKGPDEDEERKIS